MKSSRHLLVIGSAKSGTSSLFRYLADHPDVCGASLKETYFFAPSFDAHHRHTKHDSIEQFDRYFEHARSVDQLRVEATPFTMYEVDGAERIADSLDDVNVLCLVREPVSRFVSDYRFLRQRDSLGEVVPSPDEFAERQLAEPSTLGNTLSIGRYADVLPEFERHLGADRVHVAFFEDLTKNPVDELRRIAGVFDLDDEFYSSYDFKVMNKTIVVGSPLVNMLRMRAEAPVRSIRNRVLSHDRALKAFESVVDLGRSGLESLSEGSAAGEETFSSDALAALGAHYEEPNERLAEMVGRQLPHAWLPTESKLAA